MASEKDYSGKNIGNYRVIAALSKGSFGSLYVAQHIFLTRRIVAIKLLHAESLGYSRDQFLEEAQLLDALKHPHILPIFDVNIHESFPYFVTEYAYNGSLRDRIKRHSPDPLRLEEAVPILVQIGQALHYIHQQNVIHCDLKPGNILFNAKGDVLLADFGLSTMLTSANTKRVISGNGTPGYMAPEQFEGTISRKSDQYSLGCIAYELLTGQKPFTGPDALSVVFKHMEEEPILPTQLNPHVPVSIEQAILKAMAKKPDDRHVDIFAFIAALGVSIISQVPTVPSSQAFSSDPGASKSNEEQLLKEQWLDEGVAHSEAGHYAKALVAFEQATQLDPNDTEAYIGKGITLYHLGCYVEALDAYNRAIQLDASDSDAYNGKGLVLEKMQQYQEALLTYEKAVECGSISIPGWQSIGNVLQQLGKLDEAQKAYEKAHLLLTIEERYTLIMN